MALPQTGGHKSPRRPDLRQAITGQSQVPLALGSPNAIFCAIMMSDNATDFPFGAGIWSMADRNDEDPGSPGLGIATRARARTKKPTPYKVLMLNDDYTPMEFVVHVLEKFFQKDIEAATKIMLHVHHHGIGECGVFTYEIAETKVTQVMDFARKHQHPLQCVMEKK